MSFRFRLLLPLFALNFILGGYLYFVWLPQTTAVFMQEHEHELNNHLESINEIITPLVVSNNLTQVRSSFDVLLQKNSGWVDISLQSSDGTTLYPIGRSMGVEGRTQDNLVILHKELNYFGKKIAGITLITDASHEIKEVREQAIQVIVALFIMMFVVVMMMALLIEYRVHRPILGLVKAANQLSAGGFDAVLPTGTNSEIISLVASFDSMRSAIFHTQTRLQEKTESISEILESTTDAYLAVDNDFLITYVNSRAKSLLAIHVADEGDDLRKVMPDFDEFFSTRFNDAVSSHSIQMYSFLFPPTGKWIEVHIHPTKEGVAVYFRDISVRRKREEQLLLSESVFNGSSEGIVVTDSEGKILRINKAFTDITGYVNEEVLGKDPKVLASDMHDEEFYLNILSSIIEHGFWQGEIWNRRKNGDVYPEWLAINVVKDDEGDVNYYVGVFADITEKKYTEERIHQLAHHDALTGLANRTLLNDRIEQAILSAQRSDGKLAVISLDIDRFKHINDTLGHQVGDNLLKEVAGRLEGVLRESDTVSRFGSDEFVILLPVVEKNSDVADVAQKIAERLSHSYDLAGHELFVTVSMGVALYPRDAQDKVDMLKNSGAALYHAKDAGRNNYQFYTPDLNSSSLERLTMESYLRKALEKDEFVLHYQPQVDIASGNIVGVEALIRWHHPEMGLVSPAEFIPLLEDTGMIIEVGEWILKTAVEQNKAWLDQFDYPLRMAVNLSPMQIKKKNLHEMVESVLQASQLDPGLLELEITEGSIMQDAVSNIAVLNELKELGVKLAIDDFGTGYSSLSYLKRFPIDVLKIDQSFVRDISTDPDDAAIVMAIITLGHSLGLTVIAEGVETSDQLKFLNSADCDHLQGYYVAKPLGAAEFEKVLENSFVESVLKVAQ